MLCIAACVQNVYPCFYKSRAPPPALAGSPQAQRAFFMCWERWDVQTPRYISPSRSRLRRERLAAAAARGEQSPRPIEPRARVLEIQHEDALLSAALQVPLAGGRVDRVEEAAIEDRGL